MAILKAKNYIDVYRIKARAKNIETMSDRDRLSTDYLNRLMSEELKISPEDQVLDIGCGDGTLITSLSSRIQSGVGLSPTDEEVARLKTEYHQPNINFVQGLTSSVPFPDQAFNKVVCNSVLLILKSYEELEKSIQEISRVTRSSGMVFLGEIMITDELVKARRDYGDSLLKWLVFLYKNGGLKRAVPAARMLLKCMFTNEPFIITPKTPLVISADDFVALCEKHGLVFVKKYVHTLLDAHAKVYEVPSRVNFVFYKK